MTGHADYWIDARKRVEKFRKLDPNCELVFGSYGHYGHRYRFLAPVSKSRLELFEDQNGVEIPLEYRLFLIHCGAGGAGPYYGIFDFASVQKTSVQEPFLWTESQDWPEEDENPLWDLPGLLTISTSGCSIDWYLEVNGPQPGTMWVDAGPGDQLVRCDRFGKWYGDWLDRIEFGLETYHLIRRLVAENATLQAIKDQIPRPPFTNEDDGGTYVKFKDVPGRIRFRDEEILSHNVDHCWIL